MIGKTPEKTVSHATVLVIGAGGLGSHVVQFLRSARPAVAAGAPAAPPVALRVVDFDRVEAKNTASQFLSAPGVGSQKVNTLKQVMSFLWKRDIVAQNVRLTTANVDQVFGVELSRTLIVDTLDNIESRTLLQTEVRKRGLPCIHGALAGLDADIGTAYGRVVWDERFTPDAEGGLGAPTCQDGLALPFVALVAAWTAYAVQLYLSTGAKADYAVGAFGARREA